MNCKKCGQEIEQGLLYCPNCGESVQLVPEYDVLEEELLSKVVEDKRKAKDDKFATGVYKPVEIPAENPVKWTTPKEPTSKLGAIFTKKINTLLFVSFVLIAIIGVFLIVPYMGTHTYDNLMNMAVDAENAGKYAKALEYFEEAYEMDNTSFEATYGLGRMYCKMKNYETSIEMLKTALELDPNNSSIYIYLLEDYEAINDKASIYKLAESAPSDEIRTLISGYITLPPSFGIEPGTYNTDQIVQLTSESGQVFYTLNGKDPTTSGKLYTKPITLKEGTTVIKAVTQSESGEYSEVITGEYVIKYVKLSMPKVSPTDGIYNEKIMITIDVPEGCKALYNWDGTPLPENGIVYTEPIPICNGAGVLSVVIMDNNGNVSPVYYGNFVYSP